MNYQSAKCCSDRRSSWLSILFHLFLALELAVVLSQIVSPMYAEKNLTPTKTIRGHVARIDGSSVSGAKVFVRNSKKETTTVLVTDEEGLYSIHGLDPELDYQVHAEYGTLRSKVFTVSSMLRRFENLLNLRLIGGKESSSSLVLKQSVEIATKDGAAILGDWYPPPKARKGLYPAVLLLHGFGEKHGIWDQFIQEQLLGHKLGVLSIDLRVPDDDSGNLTGVAGNIDSILGDIKVSLSWLESQESIDAFRIAVVGAGCGANLAFFASGKYENVRSAVMISGDLAKAQQITERVQNFQPHSILYIATQGDSSSTASIAAFEEQTGFPRRTQVFKGSSARGTKVLSEISEASHLVVEWLRRTLE